MKYIILFLLFSSMSISFFSCRQNQNANEENDKVLVSIGDSSLIMSDVLKKIPSGLTPEDSLTLFYHIVDEWVSNLALIQYAEENLFDKENIDRMVEAYRRDLIISRYLQSMNRNADKNISEDKIRDYYSVNESSMTMEQPLVKGIFLKLAESDESLDEIRKLLSSKIGKSEIDNIEKIGMHNALQFKYFNDEWIEWNVLADEFPFRFNDADEFLNHSNLFEKSDGGAVYFLKITDYVNSGQKMPYEFAKIKISQILSLSEIKNSRKKLLHDIYHDQIKSGIMKPGIYDPVTRKMNS